jgi:hypothetical protein
MHFGNEQPANESGTTRPRLPPFLQIRASADRAVFAGKASGQSAIPPYLFAVSHLANGCSTRVWRALFQSIRKTGALLTAAMHAAERRDGSQENPAAAYERLECDARLMRRSIPRDLIRTGIALMIPSG